MVCGCLAKKLGPASAGPNFLDEAWKLMVVFARVPSSVDHGSHPAFDRKRFFLLTVHFLSCIVFYVATW